MRGEDVDCCSRKISVFCGRELSGLRSAVWILAGRCRGCRLSFSSSLGTSSNKRDILDLDRTAIGRRRVRSVFRRAHRRRSAIRSPDVGRRRRTDQFCLSFSRGNFRRAGTPRAQFSKSPAVMFEALKPLCILQRWSIRASVEQISATRDPHSSTAMKPAAGVIRSTDPAASSLNVQNELQHAGFM